MILGKLPNLHPCGVCAGQGALRKPFGGRSKASCCCSGVMSEWRVMSLKASPLSYNLMNSFEMSPQPGKKMRIA